MFVRLSRPLFLYGGFAGVALGAAVARWAGHPLALGTYLWAQLMVTAFHLMVHYANDYYDRESDALPGRRTQWSGGSGVLPAGDLPASVALVAAGVCAAIGLLAAARFALVGNTLVALLGLAIVLAAWSYSAPPLRLAARGLGELDTTLVVAILFPFVGYAAFAGTLSGPIAAVVLPCAFAIFVMMLCVEIPDADVDAATGKHNLVVRWGPSVTYGMLTVPLFLAVITACWAAFDRHIPFKHAFAIIPALAIAAALSWRVRRGDWRPATIARLGVGFYATLIGGLVVTYALSG